MTEFAFIATKKKAREQLQRAVFACDDGNGNIVFFGWGLAIRHPAIEMRIESSVVRIQ